MYYEIKHSTGDTTELLICNHERRERLQDQMFNNSEAVAAFTFRSKIVFEA